MQVTVNPGQLLAVALMFLLTACGGGSGNSTGNLPGTDPESPPGEETGTLSAGITDAAVDEVLEVNLRVTALELRRQGDGEGEADGDVVVVDLTDPDTGDAMEFNLLDFQNGETFPLFNDEEVPAGVYEHARLVLEAPARTPMECNGQDPLLGSHVVEDDMNTLAPIFVPSAANTGVKLVSPFRVPEGGAAEIVIDFDLRQALHRPPPFDCYFLRPAFRVLEVENSGAIAGTVDPFLLDNSNGMCSDDDPLTGNAVYVYEGADQVPGDLDAEAVMDDTADPLVTGTVAFDPSAGNAGQGSFHVGFLSPGDYTIALTCAADLERNPDPEAETEDEQLADDDLMFQLPQNATVEAGRTTEINFLAPQS